MELFTINHSSCNAVSYNLSLNFIESDDFNVAILLSGYQMLVLYGIFSLFPLALLHL